MQGKIFGIGLSKTGTKSLQWALQALGYKAAHFAEHFQDQRGVQTWFRGDFETDSLAGYDAAMDVPIPVYYSQLDERYPGSKFVLTVREVGSWLGSVEKHWRRNPLINNAVGQYRLLLRMATYGCHGYNESRYRYVYERHSASVIEYFKDRPQDLLVFNVVGGDGWETLCKFLDKPVPEVPFPWANKGMGTA